MRAGITEIEEQGQAQNPGLLTSGESRSRRGDLENKQAAPPLRPSLRPQLPS